MPVQDATTLRDVLLGDFFVQQAFAGGLCRALLFQRRRVFAAVRESCRIEFARPCSNRLRAGLVPVRVLACSIWLLMMLTALMAAFSFCHCALSCVGLLFQIGQFLLELLQPLFAKPRLFLS